MGRQVSAVGQAVGQVQGRGGEEPPGQKLCAGQITPPALVDPAGHPHPATAVQGPEQAGVVSPGVAPKRPAGQG